MQVDPLGFVLICAVCSALGLLCGWMGGVSEGRARERAVNRWRMAECNVLIKSWRNRAIEHGYTDEYVERERAVGSRHAPSPQVQGDGGKEAQGVKASPAPGEIRELIEQLCSAAVAYGERDTKDAENAYYAAKAHLIGSACGAKAPSHHGLCSSLDDTMPNYPNCDCGEAPSNDGVQEVGRG